VACAVARAVLWLVSSHGCTSAFDDGRASASRRKTIDSWCYWFVMAAACAVVDVSVLLFNGGGCFSNTVAINRSIILTSFCMDD